MIVVHADPVSDRIFVKLILGDEPQLEFVLTPEGALKLGSGLMMMIQHGPERWRALMKKKPAKARK